MSVNESIRIGNSWEFDKWLRIPGSPLEVMLKGEDFLGCIHFRWVGPDIEDLSRRLQNLESRVFENDRFV